jgi:hypothetical protein
MSVPLRPALLTLAAVQLGLGLFIAVAPGAFAESLGAFGERNDHLARDVATWYIALGVGLAAAADRPAWRAPVLLVALVHHVLHVINHLVDVADADPGWVGPLDVALLLVVTAILVVLLRAARR